MNCSLTAPLVSNMPRRPRNYFQVTRGPFDRHPGPLTTRPGTGCAADAGHFFRHFSVRSPSPCVQPAVLGRAFDDVQRVA